MYVLLKAYCFVLGILILFKRSTLLHLIFCNFFKRSWQHRTRCPSVWGSPRPPHGQHSSAWLQQERIYSSHVRAPGCSELLLPNVTCAEVPPSDKPRKDTPGYRGCESHLSKIIPNCFLDTCTIYTPITVYQKRFWPAFSPTPYTGRLLHVCQPSGVKIVSPTVVSICTFLVPGGIPCLYFFILCSTLPDF